MNNRNTHSKIKKKKKLLNVLFLQRLKKFKKLSDDGRVEKLWNAGYCIFSHLLQRYRHKQLSTESFANKTILKKIILKFTNQ